MVLLAGASGFIGKILAKTLYIYSYTLILLNKTFDPDFKSFCLARSIIFFELNFSPWTPLTQGLAQLVPTQLIPREQVLA